MASLIQMRPMLTNNRLPLRNLIGVKEVWMEKSIKSPHARRKFSYSISMI